MARDIPAMTLTEARAAAAPPDFTQVFAEAPREGPLLGLTVAVKDLFDVRGYRTRAGSRTRSGLPEAARDAAAVARLRAAGAGLVGHTTMTEFAYSGLGLNPHDGIPMSPAVPNGIAGGSTSGGASAVARGVAHVALGTDTGGSTRIPAAFCGLWGMKPTAREVPLAGAVPLSPSLDSVGAMARDLRTLVAAMEVLRGAPYGDAAHGGYLLPDGFGLDDLDPGVAAAFADAIAGRGAEPGGAAFFARYRAFSAATLTAVESRVHHARAWARRELIDPRVAARMAKADGLSALTYAAALEERRALAAAFAPMLGDRLLLLPTVAIRPPRPEDLAEDAAFDRLNLLALRNTTLANVVDGCAVTIPLGVPGTGLMVVGPSGADARVLAAARMLA